VEQGLEVEPAGGGDDRQRSTLRNASNGEKAREPVNRRPRGNTRLSGDGPHGGKQATVLSSSLRSGSKALEGMNASRGSLFAAGGNAVNPMVVSRAQQTCTFAEEQAVGVVRNHVGGTRSVPGGNDPKVSRWQHRRSGSGLRERGATEGRSLENPKRGIPVFTASER